MKTSNQSNGQNAKELNELRQRISQLETAAAELERALAALRESEEQYRALFESMHEGFALHEMICDEAGKPCDYRFLEVNPAFEALTGLRRSQILGKTVREVLPGIESYWIDTYGDVALNGNATRFENYSQDLGRYYAVNAFSPKKGQFATLFVDITEIKIAEKALAGSEARFRTLTEGSLAGVYIIQRDRFPYVNPAMAEIFGYPIEKILDGLQVRDLVHPEDQSFVMQNLHRRLEGKTESLHYEFRGVRKDGAIIDCEVLGRILDYQGEPAVIGTLLDITGRKHHEREADRANRALKVLSECNQMLVRTEDEGALLNEVCRILVDDGGYRLGWVGLAEQDQNKTVRPVAQAGYEEGYLDTVDITWADTERGRGPTGTAIRTGQPVIAKDILTDPNFAPWRTEAIKRGYASSISLPLFARGKPLGALNIYAEEQDAFDTQEVRLLKELSDDVAYGMLTLRTRAKQKQAEGLIRRQLTHLSALRKIDAAIADNLDLQLTLDILLDHVTHLLAVDAADVLQLKPHTQSLVCISGYGSGSSNRQASRLSRSAGLAERVVNERRMIFSDLIKEKQSLDQAKWLADEGFVAYLGLPLIAKGEIKGVLEIFNRTALDPDPEWLNFLTTSGGQAAIAIHNNELLRDLKSMNLELSHAYETTIEGWSRALDLRDKETEGHSRRVTEMTLLIARAMGMSEEELAHVRYGALLHDIGKMGVPDHILLKPGPLSEGEWEIMRRHPTYAYELLYPISYLHPALDIPYCHHEKWDGTGYPRGLKGEEIPLAARIFALVDVWDALLSDRPYRQAWSEEKATEYIREQTGEHFDPRVVELFLQMNGFKANPSRPL